MENLLDFFRLLPNGDRSSDVFRGCARAGQQPEIDAVFWHVMHGF